MRDLHDVIATDIPEREQPAERAPLEIDEDMTRQDAWMFTPLIAAAVVPALVVTALLAFGTWRAIDGVQSASIDPETTFTSRWPEQGLPTTALRGG
jgi:hypothetical protein